MIRDADFISQTAPHFLRRAVCDLYIAEGGIGQPFHSCSISILRSIAQIEDQTSNAHTRHTACEGSKNNYLGKIHQFYENQNFQK